MMERKHYAPAVKAAPDGTFTAVVATLGVVDRDGDVVAPGAFPAGSVPILPAHDSGSPPLGKCRIVERGNQAIAQGTFNLGVSAARDWFSAIKFDVAMPPAVQRWSWSFEPLVFRHELRDGKRVRVLQAVDLLEVSPVLRGASIGTVTTCAGDACTVGTVAGALAGKCGGGTGCACDLTPEQRVRITTATAALDRFEADEHDSDLKAQLATLDAAGSFLDLEARLDGHARYRFEPTPAWVAATVEGLARKVFGLHTCPAVKMIRACRPGERAHVVRRRAVLGVADVKRGAIYLNAKQDRREMFDTIGHELAHFSQHVERQPMSEAEAEEAGALIAARMAA